MVSSILTCLLIFRDLGKNINCILKAFSTQQIKKNLSTLRIVPNKEAELQKAITCGNQSTSVQSAVQLPGLAATQQ